MTYFIEQKETTANYPTISNKAKTSIVVNNLVSYNLKKSS